MIKLTNVYIPNSTSMFKFTDNSYSEDIVERSDPEDWETSVFPSGLANLRRTPGENPCVSLIPFKSIMIFKQSQRTVK